MHFKKIIRRIALPAASLMLMFSLAACGQGNETAEVSEPEEYAEDVEEDDYLEDQPLEEEPYEEEYEEQMTEDVAEGPAFVSIYRDLVSEMSDSGTADQFILAYLNDDDIPELLACDSEGSYDHENTFIYTVYNDEPVLVASVIAGVDGASLSYSDQYMIRQTGSVTGEREVFSTLDGDTLVEEFRAEMIDTLQTDAAGDEVYSYSINGTEVTQEEYEKQLSDFRAKYAPFTGIDYDGLSIMEYKNGEFEVMHQMAYWTADDTFEELDKMAEGLTGGLALAGPEYTNVTNIREDNYDDGTYFYEDMTEDAITVITNMCYQNSQRDGQAMDAYAENIVCAQVDNDAVITETVEDSELAAKLSYPVYKISYESGSNEDTRQAVGVVVLTDLYTFYYGYSCPIDYFEENADFYEGELKDVELIEY